MTRTPFFSDEYLERLYRLEPYGRWRLAQDYARRLRALFAIRSYDLIWVEKEVFPWLPAWFDNFLLGGRPVVIDYDDVWHLRYAEHPYPAIRRLLARKLESVVKRAAAVVAGNPIIAEWARDSGALRVVEIPTVVDVKRYPVQPLPHGPFTIGWIGTPITQKYLQIIAEPLRYMQARLGAKIRIIGASPDFCIPGVEIDRVRWSEDTEADEIGRCHVGVMPLADAAWERGKCGYKLVQYMASGRASVASPIGNNRTLVTNNVTGLSANTSDDWVAALSALAADREMLRRFGHAGRRRVEESLSLDAVAPKLVQLFAELLPRDVRPFDQVVVSPA